MRYDDVSFPFLGFCQMAEADLTRDSFSVRVGCARRNGK